MAKPKYLSNGVEYTARLGVWHKVPNGHGLLHVKVIEMGKEQRWGVVIWHEFGYWKAWYRPRVDRTKEAPVILQERFMDEDEAKRYLDSVLVLSPEGLKRNREAA